MDPAVQYCAINKISHSPQHYTFHNHLRPETATKVNICYGSQVHEEPGQRSERCD